MLGLLSKRLLRDLAALGACAAIVTGAARAAADDAVTVCVEQHVAGQIAEHGGELLEARRWFAACAAPTCPEVVRADCTKLLSAVEAALPSVAIAAVDENEQDVASATVRIDDGPPRPVDGRAVPLDPGVHRLTVEAEGYLTRTLNLVLREGEKARPLVVRLAAARPRPTPTLPPPAPAPSPSPSKDEALHETSTHPLVYVFGGLGAVAAASWAYFGIRGLDQRADCRDRQPCAEDVNTKLLAADISLLVSVASLAAGSYFLFIHPNERTDTADRKKIRWGSRIGPSSVELGVGTAF